VVGFPLDTTNRAPAVDVLDASRASTSFPKRYTISLQLTRCWHTARLITLNSLRGRGR